MKLSYGQKQHTKDLTRLYNTLCKYEMRLRSVAADLGPIIAEVEDALADVSGE